MATALFQAELKLDQGVMTMKVEDRLIILRTGQVKANSNLIRSITSNSLYH